MGDSGWVQYLDDFSLSLIFISSNIYFLWRASRTFYEQKGKRLLFKVPLALMSLYFSLEVYRFLLFFLTYWSV